MDILSEWTESQLFWWEMNLPFFEVPFADILKEDISISDKKNIGSRRRTLVHTPTHTHTHTHKCITKGCSDKDRKFFKWNTDKKV